MVLTSDHGEMGGDHWLLEKLGFWDESYRVPLIVVDPRPEADGSRGTIIDAVTESVDVLPTICDFMDVETPLQVDGWSLAPFLRGEPAPAHWRDTAHFEWSFSDPVNQLAELGFGIPMSHCALAVSRGPRYKYVQFAADASLMPPLLFDLDERSRTATQSPDRGRRRQQCRRLAGHPRVTAVADADGGTNAERHLPRPRAGPRRSSGHVALRDRPSAGGVEC